MNQTETIAFICILVAMLTLGLVIAVANERVRREIMNAHTAFREAALADLALRYEQEARSISYSSQPEAITAMEQIALDATHERHEFSTLQIATGMTAALQALTSKGSAVIFTPAANVYLKDNLHMRRRVKQVYPVNGLSCSPLVIAELNAIARLLGLTSLPRAEQWEAIVLKPEDFSIAPKKPGLRARLKAG